MDSEHSFISSFSTSTDIMEAAEIIAPLFRGRVVDEEGNPARFISVHNVHYSRVELGNVIQFHIIAEMQSDRGELRQPITLREFRYNALMEDEVVRYRELERRCHLFPDVDPEPLLHADHDRNFIIYEQVEGYSLDQFAIPPESMDFLIGRITGILQGDHVFPLDENTIRELLIFLLMNQPFTDEERESVVEMLEKQFELIQSSTGGYIACTSISPEEFAYFPLSDQLKFDVKTINGGKSLYVRIPMSQRDNLSNDRMSDIAQHFHQRAMMEFKSNGDLKETQASIFSYLQGYNGVARELQLPRLAEMYPHGNTLDLQFLTAAWLDEAVKIRDDTNLNGLFDRDMLRYSYYLLKEEPFSKLISL
ncbi:MAG: hypothetical protein ACXAB7_22785 [Candidatus Kariarchaeaceae archaeon]